MLHHAKGQALTKDSTKARMQRRCHHLMSHENEGPEYVPSGSVRPQHPIHVATYEHTATCYCQARNLVYY